MRFETTPARVAAPGAAGDRHRVLVGAAGVVAVAAIATAGVTADVPARADTAPPQARAAAQPAAARARAPREFRPMIVALHRVSPPPRATGEEDPIRLLWRSLDAQYGLRPPPQPRDEEPLAAGAPTISSARLG